MPRPISIVNGMIRNTYYLLKVLGGLMPLPYINYKWYDTPTY